MGGKFTQVKRYNQAALFTRNNIFAYDKATGAIDTTFVPELDGQVTAMLKAADGNIYVAGQFKNVNGVAGGYLVKLNPVTGQKVTALNDTERMVYDLHLHGGVLFAGGTFTKIRNLVRTNSRCSTPPTGQAVGADDARHGRGHRHHPGHAPRRQPGRCPPRRHRQLHAGRRPVPAEHRPARRQRHGRHRELLVHRRLPSGPVLEWLRHVHP